MNIAMTLPVAVTLAGCGSPASGPGWTTLVDGDKSLEN